jgi:hypothetical protein
VLFSFFLILRFFVQTKREFWLATIVFISAWFNVAPRRFQKFIIFAVPYVKMLVIYFNEAIIMEKYVSNPRFWSWKVNVKITCF